MYKIIHWFISMRLVGNDSFHVWKWVLSSWALGIYSHCEGNIRWKKRCLIGSEDIERCIRLIQTMMVFWEKICIATPLPLIQVMTSDSLISYYSFVARNISSVALWSLHLLHVMLLLNRFEIKVLLLINKSVSCSVEIVSFSGKKDKVRFKRSVTIDLHDPDEVSQLHLAQLVKVIDGQQWQYMM